ncbi:MAG: sigma-E factor negative regulatory protein [Ottowia sp.]|uniref:sigma-E factor negative regulatory protein n=1 Tax=Ottowia sp. TaxID=1898956 RepID=UPI0039E6E120
MNTQIETRMDHETMSALMDGQLRGAELSAALRDMETAEARESWLLYHLVGDVLRSSELAHGRHDLALAERVCRHLGPQARPAPVMVRKADQSAANDGVFRWKMVAGLASFAAVAAMGWVALGTVGTPPAGPRMAQVPAAPAAGGAQVVAVAAMPAPAASLPTQPAESPPVMLRDPRLDELLAAHRAAAGASALGNAAGFLRNATFEGPGR